MCNQEVEVAKACTKFWQVHEWPVDKKSKRRFHQHYMLHDWNKGPFLCTHKLSPHPNHYTQGFVRHCLDDKLFSCCVVYTAASDHKHMIGVVHATGPLGRSSEAYEPHSTYHA